MCGESVSSSAPASVVNRVLIQCSIHKWSYQAKRTLYICCFISCSLSHNCRVMISLDCVCHKTDKKGSMTPYHQPVVRSEMSSYSCVKVQRGDSSGMNAESW